MQKKIPYVGLLFTLLLPASALAAQVQVTLGNNSISPGTVNINAGDTVVWTNTSSLNQSVTADDLTFQSGFIAPGGQFAATFNQTGAYNYYDNAQGSALLGEVEVSGTSITTPTSSTIPTEYVNPAATTNYTTTSSSNGDTASSLAAEVQSLIAEIDSLEGGSAPVTGAPAYIAGGSCPEIGRVLTLGSSGSDVTSLQEFLGVSATGYYDATTETAVENWQAANNIISYGTPQTTGYGQVGPRTAAAMRLACNSSTTQPASGNNTGVVGGFLQVSPISGTAPLGVTVVATVNTAGSCGGGSYTLDYGDGTDQIIPIASNNCSQQNEQFQHTYQSAGFYTVTLSSGAHYTTATVSVAGSSPSTPTASSTAASGSMNAFITSGAAPLATTFYISCASGLAYDVVFGDGTDLGSSGVSQSSCTGNLQAVSHTYTTPGTFSAQLDIFVRTAQGTVSSQAVASQVIQVSGAVANPTTGSGPSSYPAPTLTAGISGNPLEVQLQFSALSCGQAYTINWGDSSGAQSPSNANCSSGTSDQTVTYSPTHTYSQAQNYTITLQRTLGSGNPQTDSVQVDISD